ncbi:MAG: coproporphyrinogen III oxidase, partial [Verrucomicrobiota bacterium]|nr:coproporphyrinogen III oxidase [Verrucomicrobiota bacterium]
VDFAGEHGWHQYEVANFARHDGDETFEIPSRACRHNINYWRGGDHHAIGPSATGYVRGVRTKNIANTQIYCERLERDESPVDTREGLSPLSRAGETAAFGLRMTVGWPFDEFQRVTGHDLRTEWNDTMNDWVGRNQAIRDPDSFRLNREGLRFADTAARDFLR